MTEPVRRPGFYTQVYLSVTDFPFYRSIFNQPTRATLRYLLFLSAHVALAQTLLAAWIYAPEASRFFRWARENFPALQVRDGNLEIHAAQPLVKHYEGNPAATFVFDTTGTYEDSRSPDELTVLLTRENMIIEYQARTQTYPWKDFGPFTLNPGDWSQLESALSWGYYPAGYSFFLILTLLIKSLQAACLSFFSFAATARYGIRLPFRSYFTIALYALTPAIVIDLAVSLTGIGISYFNFIYLAIAAIYAYLAAQRCVMQES